MQDMSVGVSIGLAVKGISELTKINSGVLKLKNGILDTKKAILSLDSTKLSSLKEQIKETRKALFADLTSNLGNLTNSVAIGVPIKLAIDDEAAFANVKKYVDDSKENLTKLKNQIRSLSSELGSSFSDIADISAGGGKINLKGDELVKYTRLLSTASVAFEMSSNSVAKAANNMLVGFKLKDVGELNKFFDIVNLLDNRVTNANANDILEATSLTAGNANILGLKEKDAAAFASAMLSTGKATSVVGTSLNALYTKLSMADKQGKAFQDALKEIGLDSTYLKTALSKDAAGAITLFLEQLSKADKSRQSGLLYDLVGGNFGDEIAGLLGNIDGLKQALSYANNSDSEGSMNKELQTKLETTKSGIERLMQSWRNLGSAIGDTFLPLSNSVANILSTFAGWLNRLNARFAKLSAGVVSVAAGLMIFKPLLLIAKIAIFSLTDGFLGVVKVLSIFKNALALSKIRLILSTTATLAHASAVWLVGARLKASIVLTYAYSAANKALSGVMNFLKLSIFTTAGALRILKFALISTGIGAIAVGIGTAAVWIIKNWDKVKAWFMDFISWLSPAFEPVIQSIKNVFNPLFGWFEEKFAWIKGSIDSLVKGASDITGSITNGVSSAFGTVMEFVGLGGDKNETYTDSNSTFIQNSLTPAPIKANSAPSYNINFGDIKTGSNFDEEAMKKAVINEIKRQEMNAKNRSVIGK